jgi:2-keto-4-pentenoate hydratase
MTEFTQKELDIFANKILEDYDAKDPGTIFKKKIKLSNNNALLLQLKVTKLRINRGEEVIGYKIGCVAKDTQKKMGFVQPAWGSLWKNELFESGVKLHKKDYSNPAMEAEFGVKLNREIDPKLVSFDYILDSIESIFPLIEIHNLVFNGDEPYGAELLANNALHAGVILGPETKTINNNKITDLKLIYDNKTIDTWANKKWPYDMLSEIEWLVKEQAKIDNLLKKDDLILTGAYGFPVPIDNKTLIKVTSSEFGNVEAKFI